MGEEIIKKILIAFIVIIVITLVIFSIIFYWIGKKTQGPVLTETIIRHGDASCMYNGGESCEGCELASQDETCLAYLPEGDIIGSINPENNKAKLIAKNTKGNTSVIESPYGFDKVIKLATGEYAVVASNRENDNFKDYDSIFLVTFPNGMPSISTLTSDSGWGGYYEPANIWMLVPMGVDRSYKNLILKVYDNFGKIKDEFAFGKELEKIKELDDVNVHVISAVPITENNMLINFGKSGLPKYEVYKQIIISIKNRNVQEL